MSQLLDDRNLSIHRLQAFHEFLDREKAFDPGYALERGLLEEIGEVVTAIRDLKEADDPCAPEKARAHLDEELADCLA